MGYIVTSCGSSPSQASAVAEAMADKMDGGRVKRNVRGASLEDEAFSWARTAAENEELLNPS